MYGICVIHFFCVISIFIAAKLGSKQVTSDDEVRVKVSYLQMQQNEQKAYPVNCIISWSDLVSVKSETLKGDSNIECM